MSINDTVECNKKFGHELHIDFVYLGEYTKINNANSITSKKYESIDIEIEIGVHDITKEKINELLNMKIDEYYSDKQIPSPSTNNLLKDIPARLYNAIIKYKQYKGIACSRK
jgi:hypothetical protein